MDNDDPEMILPCFSFLSVFFAAFLAASTVLRLSVRPNVTTSMELFRLASAQDGQCGVNVITNLAVKPRFSR